MRLWIDAEFNEFRGELISIALVDEQGREFYEVLPPPAAGYGPWVAENVVPVLNKTATTLPELQSRLATFMAGYDATHLIADWPEDIEHFLRLLIVGAGQRIGPDCWTMEVRSDLPGPAETSRIPHNALEDAKALRACHLLMEAAWSHARDGRPADGPGAEMVPAPDPQAAHVGPPDWLRLAQECGGAVYRNRAMPTERAVAFGNESWDRFTAALSAVATAAAVASGETKESQG